MYANDQELSAFKVLLINENLEEAKRIFTLLPEPEIRNEDFLEISWALHNIVSEKVHPLYVSQEEINDKSHVTFNLNFAGFFR